MGHPCSGLKRSSVPVGLQLQGLASLQTLSGKLPITMALSVVHTLGCSAVLRASVQFKQTSHHRSLGQQGFDPSVMFSAVTKACCTLFELFYTWHNCHLGI